MGYDARCALRYEGRSASGTAVLEQNALIVRGPVRLAIPIAAISRVTSEGGWLRIRFGERSAELGLGAAAEKWARRITRPPSRLDKLGIKPGLRVLIVGAVGRDFIGELRAAGAVVTRRCGVRPAFDLVFYGVRRPEPFTRLATLASAIVPGGAIWILRPKGSQGVTEAETMAAGRRAGLVDVKVVSFSETLTAEKFVIRVAKRSARSRRTPALVR